MKTKNDGLTKCQRCGRLIDPSYPCIFCNDEFMKCARCGELIDPSYPCIYCNQNGNDRPADAPLHGWTPIARHMRKAPKIAKKIYTVPGSYGHLYWTPDGKPNTHPTSATATLQHYLNDHPENANQENTKDNLIQWVNPISSSEKAEEPTVLETYKTD